MAEGDANPTHRDVIFDAAGTLVRTQIQCRPTLPVDLKIAGPTVIEEPNSTTLLHPGDRATVSEAGHLIITVGARG